MADDPKSLMKKTDDELTFDALSAMPGSAVSLLNHLQKRMHSQALDANSEEIPG